MHYPVTQPELPCTLGPYSQAVLAGPFLFISGLAGCDPATGRLAGETFEAQARQAFANLTAVLEAAGSDLSQVVKMTIYLVDPDALTMLDQFYAEHFPTNPPARSAPIVQLPHGVLISIEAIAMASTPGQKDEQAVSHF
jgi:2-iminobutanoate/2-iminopropanoate deaminase